MKKLKRVMLSILLIALVCGGFAVYNFLYQSSHFYSTENASISADMITITPEITGKLLEWDVKEGDTVKKGQILGHQDLSMLVTNNSINASALSSTADAFVSKADIKAPIDGKIIQSNVVLNQVLSPGLDVATLADTSHLFIKANIEETNIFSIQIGQKVDIRVDAYPSKTFTGYVERIGQASESVFSPFPSLNTSGEFSKKTQLIPVRISLINDDHLPFMPGMNTTVKIHIK